MLKGSVGPSHQEGGESQADSITAACCAAVCHTLAVVYGVLVIWTVLWGHTFVLRRSDTALGAGYLASQLGSSLTAT